MPFLCVASTIVVFSSSAVSGAVVATDQALSPFPAGHDDAALQYNASTKSDCQHPSNHERNQAVQVHLLTSPIRMHPLDICVGCDHNLALTYTSVVLPIILSFL